MQGAETEERLTTREDCARVWRWLDIDSKISRSIGGEVLHALSCIESLVARHWSQESPEPHSTQHILCFCKQHGEMGGVCDIM